MKRECPEWASNIGVQVRLLTNDEPHNEKSAIASLLRQIDESELAMRSGEGAVEAKRPQELPVSSSPASRFIRE